MALNAITTHQILTIFSWFVLTVLIAFLLLIARFYQNVSGERTHFWGFIVPIIFFGLASARYAFIDQISGDLFGDMLLFIGGVTLGGLCLWLYRLMTQR